MAKPLRFVLAIDQICLYNNTMKLTLQTQLLPDPVQVIALEATLRTFNDACTWLAGEAFNLKTANKIALQQVYYAQLREKFGLSAQMAVRCIAQVCEAYKRDKKIQPKFKAFSSMPYDQRMMSFKGLDKVSLLTLSGRIIVPFIMGKYQSEKFSNAKGQCDLVHRKDGKWFLLVTVDLPDGTKPNTKDFIGIDLGIVNILTDSDGASHSGAGIDACRERIHALKHNLQIAAGGRKRRGFRAKNIKRKLKSLSGKEARYKKDVNHQISKQIVAKAKGTGRGIALENLKGIRTRTRFRKPQRSRMGGWSFHQLRVYIEYKAQIAGVMVALVDPRNTSRECFKCGHIAKANRLSQKEFKCVCCGHTANADENAALNIRARAAVNLPIVSETPLAA